MARQAYGSWAPDFAGVDARTDAGVILQIAKNCLPVGTAYGPLRALAQDSSFALNATCKGLFYARSSSGGFLIFACTRTQIFRYVPGTGWVDYTRPIGNDSFTKILLHMDGTDAATTFTDSNAGGSAHTWTANGDAQIDTGQSKFGGASGLFDGTGDYVATPDHADFSLGTGDFTVDLWFRCNAAGGSLQYICGQGNSTLTAATTTFYLRRETSNVITANVSNGSAFTTVTGTTQFTNALNTGWNHLALVRTGNTLKLFLNGTQEGGDVSFSGTVPDSANAFSVGRGGELTTTPWTGWLDEFRLSVGTARWTAAFTPFPNAYDSNALYACAADDYWTGTQFGSLLILGNIADNPQVLDLDSGATQFTDLGGSPPKARYWTTVGFFVVAGCLSTDNRAVHNSAIGSATGWTVGTNLSDSQTLYDGGRVTGVVDGGANGQFAYVTQEKSVRRMIFQVGSQTAFRYEQIDKAHGSSVGWGLVQTGNGAYYIDDAGFYYIGPEGIVPIGADTFDQWFRDNVDQDRFFETHGFCDPFGQRVFWAFYNSASSTYFDRLLILDWRLRRPTYAEATAQFWAALATPGVTLESLDALFSSIDSMTASLDSTQFTGGRPLLGAINNSGYLAFASGAPMDALLTTAPIQINPGGRANIEAVEPIGVFNDATLAVRVGKRSNMKTAVTYGASITPSTKTGVARMFSDGRFHEIETSIVQDSGNLWDLAQGFDLDAVPTGTI